MSTASPLRDRLRVALLDARRARDAVTTSAIRAAVSALENAEAVPVETMPSAGAVEAAQLGVGAADAPRRVLSEQEEQTLLDAEVADLRAAAGVYAEVGDHARATEATRAAEVLAGLR